MSQPEQKSQNDHLQPEPVEEAQTQQEQSGESTNQEAVAQEAAE